MKGFRRELSRLYRTNESINLYDSLYPTTIQILRALTIAVLVGLFVVDSTWMTIGIGSIAAMIELLSNLFEPIESAGSELQSLQQALAAIDRIDEFFGEEPQSPQNQELKQEEIQVDELTFHNVSFAYETDQPVLKNVELKLQRGQRVTFVGRTGVGKSTLLKLVLGLIVPDEGQIQLNGIDVHTIPDRLRRSVYGYVDQNFPIIDGTLRQQITLGDETILDQQILKALSDVGLNELVSEHPKGLDAKINQELSLSEGQKQLIAIARAIVTDAPILLLDEISSGMDGSTESEIDQVLRNIAKQRIIMTVSHRLTMLEEEDNVVILMEGKIKNQGKVRDLLVEDAWFSQTMKMQKQKLNVL
jgi:ATP-binding cassette subfamily B protein